MMLAPQQQSTTQTWPVPDDAGDLQAIVQDQARTMTANMSLLVAYQSTLNNVQTQIPATANGTSTGGTALTVTNTVGTILIDSVIVGAGIPSGTTVIGQTGGVPGGNGTYTTSQPTTVSAVNLTFSPGPMNWPPNNDPEDLTLTVQQQTAVIRNQTALIQQYQDLLNSSGTPAPPSGP